MSHKHLFFGMFSNDKNAQYMWKKLNENTYFNKKYANNEIAQTNRSLAKMYVLPKIQICR